MFWAAFYFFFCSSASLTLAVKLVSLFFNNNWRNSDFTCICKVTHCPGPRLLFEKVNFNGQNQLGRPVHAFTQRIDNLTGLPPVEWLTSNVYSRDKFTVYLVMKMYIYFNVSRPTFFYSYIIINHNNVYTITDDYAYNSSVCCFTHMHTDIISYIA